MRLINCIASAAVQLPQRTAVATPILAGHSPLAPPNPCNRRTGMEDPFLLEMASQRSIRIRAHVDTALHALIHTHPLEMT